MKRTREMNAMNAGTGGERFHRINVHIVVNSVANLSKPRRWRANLAIDDATYLREQLGCQIVE
jgi:hypothetical protein